MTEFERHQSYIQNLCIALAHRWQPGRLFVILTSYLDESGIHQGSPATVFAGAMATAGQWQRYEIEINRLKSRYGFSVFHATDLKTGSGEFSGWPQEKKLSLFHDLGMASSGLMEAVTSLLPNAEYEAHYKRIQSDHRKLKLDSKYALCFRYVLIHLVAEAIRRLGHHKKFGKTKFNLVLEHGHPNAQEATHVFFDLQAELEKSGINLLGEMTLSKKQNCDFLWVADALAHGEYVMYREGIGRNTDASGGATKGVTGLTHLEFHADGLEQQKAILTEALNRRLAWGARSAKAQHA